MALMSSNNLIHYSRAEVACSIAWLPESLAGRVEELFNCHQAKHVLGCETIISPLQQHDGYVHTCIIYIMYVYRNMYTAAMYTYMTCCIYIDIYIYIYIYI